MSQPASRVSTRGHLILLVLASLVVTVPSIFTRDPWNPDEPRYQEVAREMASRGDYLVPHLNGSPYSDKPPMLFWLAAGLWKLGFGLASSRVVSAAATVGTLLLVYALGRRLYDAPEVGFLAALVTLTCTMFLRLSSIGVLDPLLTCFVVAAVYAGLRAFEGAARGRWWLAAYAAVACGILTKGPVALLVPFVALLAYGLVRRRDVSGGGWWHLAGAVLMLALVAAWVAPAALTGGEDYADDLLLRQTLRRLSKSDSHQEPFYFYLKWAPATFFPWIVLLPLAFLSALRAARAGGERRNWLPVLWLGALLLVFSAFSGKRERYIMPLIPPAGLLCGAYLWRVARDGARWPRWHRGLWAVGLALLAGLGIAFAVVAVHPSPLIRHAAQEAVGDVPELAAGLEAELEAGTTAARRALLVVAGMAAVALAVGAVRTAGECRRVGLTIAVILTLSLAADLTVLPVANRLKSGRGVIDTARPALDRADNVYLLKEDFSGVYNLYLSVDRLPFVRSTPELLRRLSSEERIAVIGVLERFNEGVDHPKARLATLEVVGHRIMAVLVNFPIAEEASAPSEPR